MEIVNEPISIKVVTIIEENKKTYSILIDQYLKECVKAYELNSIHDIKFDFGTDASNLNKADLYIIGTFLDMGGINPEYSHLLNLHFSGLCSILILILEGPKPYLAHNVENSKNIERINVSPEYSIDVFKKIIGHIDLIVDLKRKYKTPLYHKVAKIINGAKNKKVIDLSNCGLQEIPSEVFGLSQIEELILNNSLPTEIEMVEGTVISELKNPNNKIQLELHFLINNIKEIHSDIKKLKKLKYFSLQGTKDFRINLQYLGGLINHPSLKELHLSYCNFSSLRDFASLPALEYLYLTNNSINELDLNPEKMPLLKKLILTNNKIHQVKDEKLFQKLLKQLEYINLKNNPINLEWLNPAILDASGDNKEEILKLLSLSLKGLLNRVNSLPQKVILLGNSEVGKTELSKILIKDKSQFPDHGTTHGLKIRKWNLGKKYNAKSVYIYDFGGQDFYHSVYNMFFTYDTIYVIVWDEKSLENQSFVSKDSNDTFIKYNPKYWVKNIQYFLDRDLFDNVNQHIEVISLHNNFNLNTDYQHLATDMKALNHHFTLNLKSKNDAIKKMKMDLLKQSIFEISNQFDNKFSLSQSDLDIFNHVLKIFNQDIYKKYTLEEFYDEFGKPSYGGFLLVMHQKGLVFHLHQHDDLKDFVWINPCTISNKIYEILDKTSLLDKGELLESTFDKEINKDSELCT